MDGRNGQHILTEQLYFASFTVASVITNEVDMRYYNDLLNPIPEEIHFCALDTALYAGTGRWVDPGAFFPGGRPVVPGTTSPFFFKKLF